MLAKTGPDSLILSLGVPRLDPAHTRLLRHGTRLYVCPDPRLIVAEQVRVFLVEHAVDFQDVAVPGGALEFVARAVEAEDERLFGWENVGAGLFIFFLFVLVLPESEVGFGAVVAMRSAVVGLFRGGAVWFAGTV